MIYIILIVSLLIETSHSATTKAPSRSVSLCGAGLSELLERDENGRTINSASSTRDHVVALTTVGETITVPLTNNKSDSDHLHCSLTIQSFSSSILLIDISSSISILQSYQPDPPPRCDENHPEESCFSLSFVEERADSLSSNSFYRSISIWSLINDDKTQFTSTGSSVRIIVESWMTENDKTLKKFIKNIFPLRVKVIDNTEFYEGRIENNNNTMNSYILSPRYPSAYTQDVEKRYIMQNKNPSGFIRMIFDDFDINVQSEIEIIDYDGTELFSSRVDFRRPPAIISTGPRLEVNFKGHDFTNEIGFRARFDYVDDSRWSDMPSNELCDQTFDAFGGEIRLDGRNELIDKYIDCIFIIKRRNSLIGRNYDRIYLRVDEFRLHGDNLRLEVKEGSISTGDGLLTLYDAQHSYELLDKQPKNGFIVSTDEPAFFIRLRGLLKSTVGLNIVYTLFYRWAGPICPGTGEFRCSNQRCIKASLRCDSIDHCGDNSDEGCEGDSNKVFLNGMLDGLHGPKSQQPESDISSLLALVLGVCGIIVLLLVTVTVVLKVYDRRRHERARRRVPTVDSNGDSLPHHPEVAPSIQTVGERRFYVIPETQISVIEAPPCYDDALKHPSVPTGRSSGAAYTNVAFVGGPPPDITTASGTGTPSESPIPSFEESRVEIKDQEMRDENEVTLQEDRPSSSTTSPSRIIRKNSNYDEDSV